MSFPNQQVNSGSIPTFAPPPMSATLQREQAKRTPKLKTRTKPAVTRKKHTPLQRSRLFLLPMILVLTFTILILGVIYAYCVASPHTTLTDAQLASPSEIEVDSSIFSRRQFVPNSPNPLGPIPTTGPSKRAESSSPEGATLDAISAALNATSSNHGRVTSQHPRNKSSLSPSLIFYTLTSPLFTILLVSAELILTISSSSPDTSSPTVMTSPHPTPRSRFSFTLTSQRAHLAVLIITVINVASLIVTTSFWTHCELPSPLITKNSLICPAEVRGHWMGGIHEVSIAKVTIGWLVVLGLVWHAVCVAKGMQTERRRWAAGEHGDVEEITVKMEGEDLEKGRGLGRMRGVRFS